MNRTLNNLEEKKLIIKKKSEKDRRSVFVIFNEEKISQYEKGHNEVLQIVDNIIEKIEDKIGAEKTKEIVNILNTISDAAIETINQ